MAFLSLAFSQAVQTFAGDTSIPFTLLSRKHLNSSVSSCISQAVFDTASLIDPSHGDIFLQTSPTEPALRFLYRGRVLVLTTEQHGVCASYNGMQVRDFALPAFRKRIDG